MTERFPLLKEYSYPYVRMVLFSTAFLAFLFAWFRISVSNGMMFSVILLETALFQMLFRYRKYPAMYVVLFLTGILFGILTFHNQESFAGLWEGYTAWISPIGIGNENASLKDSFLYETISVILLIFLMMIPVHYLRQFFAVRQTVSLVFIMLCVIYAFLRIAISKLGMACAMGYILYCLMELVHSHLYHSGEGKQKEAMTSLAFIVVLFSAVLCVIPYSEKPYSWEFVKSTWRSIAHTGQNIYEDITLFFRRENGIFEVNFSGYSEKTTLGGSLIRSNDPVLQVKFEGGKTNLYLIGNIQSVYENGEWKNMETTSQEHYLSYQWDVIELFYALYRSGSLEQGQELVTLRTIQAEFLKLHTRSIFYPLKMISNSLSEKEYGQEMENLRFYKMHEASTKYRIPFLDLNFYHTLVTDFIRQQEGYRYPKEYRGDSSQELKKALSAAYPYLSSVVIPNNVEKMLRERADFIKENYLQIPTAYEKRLKELAVSLTKDYSSAYDKCKAIETYLNGYTYTLTPPAAEAGTDIVEHFLFDSREGYCTYFASAFVLMCRSLGYPARYVTGFCVPLWTENITTYTVMSSDAHAWPEVYLEGIGWIPFEPTAGFADIRYMPGRQADVILDNQRQYVTTGDEIEHMPDTALDETKDTEDFAGADERQKRKLYQYVGILLGGIFLTVTFIIFGYLAWKICRYHYHYRYGTQSEKLESIAEFLMILLQAIHMERVKGQTLLQYAKEIHREYPDIGILDFAAEYMDYRYGNCSVSKEQILRTEQIRDYFMKVVQQRYGKISYLRFMIRCYLSLT